MLSYTDIGRRHFLANQQKMIISTTDTPITIAVANILGVSSTDSRWDVVVVVVVILISAIMMSFRWKTNINEYEKKKINFGIKKWVVIKITGSLVGGGVGVCWIS